MNRRDELLRELEKPPKRNHFFATTLTKNMFSTMDGLYDFAQVKRWNKKRVNFLRKDELFFPINTNDSHWSLVVVNPKKKTFTYYNSLNGDCSNQELFA
jgi:Ulp1 family protease